MTHVNVLFHRLLVSETQIDRQDKFVIYIYVYKWEKPKTSQVKMILAQLIPGRIDPIPIKIKVSDAKDYHAIFYSYGGGVNLF